MDEVGAVPGSDLIILDYEPNLLKACVERDLRPVLVRTVQSHLRGNYFSLPPSTVEVVVERTDELGAVWSGLLRQLGTEFPERVAGVVTYDEFSVPTAAALAALLDLPGVTLGEAALMRDKELQKAAVRSNGIPCASSRLAVPGSPDLEGAYSGPSVVKPIAGGGSQSTFVIEDVESYRSLMTKLRKDGSGAYLIESLVDVQDEWSVDGIVQDGNVIFASVGLYSSPALSFATSSKPYEIRRVEGTAFQKERQEAVAVAESAIGALGLSAGVFHLELLRDRDGRFNFGECAARAGGMMIPQSVDLKHGVSMAEAAVGIALGSKVELAISESPLHVASTTLQARPGTIVHVPAETELLSLPYVHDLWMSATLGNVVDDSPSSYLNAQGVCVVAGATAEELTANLVAVQHLFAERVVTAPTHEVESVQLAFTRSHSSRARHS